MQNIPKLSVITVCKNAASTIERTIQSVNIQSYSNIEYIIIDGCSNDGTIEILNIYEAKISKLIIEPDNGIFDAMNKGIINATGDLVCFLNADDYLVSPFSIEILIKKIPLDKCDLFYAQILWVDPNSSSIIATNHSFIRDKYQLYKSCFPHPATIYKRALFDRIGLFDIKFKYLADYEWNMRALVKHKLKFHFVEIIFSVFTVGGFSTLSKYRTERSSELKTLREKYYSKLEILFFESKLFETVYSYKKLVKGVRLILKIKLNKVY